MQIPLLPYLIAVNILAFAVTVHDLLCDRKVRPMLPTPLWVVLACAGGGPGILVAFPVAHGHIYKRTVSRLFAAIISSILWTIGALTTAGLVHFDVDSLTEALRAPHPVLVAYLVAVNLVTFLAFVADKRQARLERSRIPEAALLGLSLAGGAVGGLLGMRLAHHKTAKPYFRWGLPLCLITDLVVLACLLQAGLI